MKCEEIVNKYFLTGIKITGTFYNVEKINVEKQYLICSCYDNCENSEEQMHVFQFTFDELDSVNTEYYQSVKIS